MEIKSSNQEFNAYLTHHILKFYYELFFFPLWWKKGGEGGEATSFSQTSWHSAILYHLKKVLISGHPLLSILQLLPICPSQKTPWKESPHVSTSVAIYHSIRSSPQSWILRTDTVGPSQSHKCGTNPVSPSPFWKTCSTGSVNTSC